MQVIFLHTSNRKSFTKMSRLDVCELRNSFLFKYNNNNK